MTDLDRRQFGVLALAAVASVANSAQAAVSDKRTSIFVGGSGIISSGFSMGMLVTDIPEIHLMEIKKIREEVKYKRKFKFRTTESMKIHYFDKLFDYFLGQNEMYFCAENFTYKWPDDASSRDLVYRKMHEINLNAAKLKNKNFDVFIVNRSKLPNTNFVGMLQSLPPWYPKVNIIGAHDNYLIECSSFLTSLTRIRSNEPAEKTTKDIILKSALEKINTKKFSTGIYGKNRFIRINETYI